MTLGAVPTNQAVIDAGPIHAAAGRLLMHNVTAIAGTYHAGVASLSSGLLLLHSLMTFQTFDVRSAQQRLVAVPARDLFFGMIAAQPAGLHISFPLSGHRPKRDRQDSDDHPDRPGSFLPGVFPAQGRTFP